MGVKHLKARLIGVLLAAVLAAGMLPAVELRADTATIGNTFETPTDYAQYTNANDNAKLLLDVNRMVLKYKDSVCGVLSRFSGRPVWKESGYPIIAAIQTWTSKSGIEYIDLFWWKGYNNESEFSASAETGFYGMYGFYNRYQFVYIDGKLQETAMDYDGNITGYLLDSYVFDNNYAVMYVENYTNSKGNVQPTCNGSILYGKSPTPYDFTYETTFRMLTDGAVTYNTYYYDDCYKAGDDIIKCVARANATNESGHKVAVEAVTLATGAKQVAYMDNPAIMCQISSYGSTYVIASTNDDNLLSLLGVETYTELRWNVKTQAWVPPAWDDILNNNPTIHDFPGTDVINPDGTSPFDTADSIPAVTGLSVAAYGQDVQLSYADYSKLYGNSLMHVSASPSSAADAWGLGSTLQWSLDGSPGDFDIKLQVAAKISVQLSDGTTKTHPLILQDYNGAHPGNNTAFQIGAADGQATIALYDLIIALEDKYTGYIDNPPAKLLGVIYYLTPFYYKDGTYYRGSPVSTAHSVNAGFSAVPVAPLPTAGPSNPGGWITDDSFWDAMGSFSQYVRDGIANGIASAGSFFSGVIGSVRGIMGDLGEIPALLSELFSFLPPEIVSAVGIGLGLWLLPSLLGLACTGLKAVGSLCSTLFGFISSFL